MRAWPRRAQPRCPRCCVALALQVAPRGELYILAHGQWESGFFFGPDVPGRAAVLIHESRHWNGCRDHTDKEQDGFFGDGGAYAWQAVWLQWYATAAVNAPDELRCSAQCTANAILASKFEMDVGFRGTGAPNCGF